MYPITIQICTPPKEIKTNRVNFLLLLFKNKTPKKDMLYHSYGVIILVQISLSNSFVF